MYRRRVYRQCIAEMFGTFLLVLFGLSAGANVMLGNEIGGGIAKSMMTGGLSIRFGWAMGIYFGIISCAKISGGHINPAVTITMAVF